MFDVISTAKNTQWLSFPTLCSKYTHSHVSNEDVDLQVVPGKTYFAEFNKKFGFELLRTTNKDNKDIIQRAKKRQLEDLSCGAISKLCGSEIAIGLTTGFIRIFSTQDSDFKNFKFKPDRIGNSVIGLDFSNNDEYLAAVYDNYDINLFGLKTKIKTDTFRFDGISTLVRFHPVRKFALAIGSYEGAITMLDIQTKKKLFFDKAAHDAPIRDISMFESSQDLFASCGYDCNIKVFDLRKRSVVQKYKQAHPMSTVCVSSCGTFCVAGNLKGDVISYDFRSMKDPLDTKRVHDSAVVRVAFVPCVTTTDNLTLDYNINSTNIEISTPLYKSKRSTVSASRQSNNVDSFAKFVDVCHHINGADSEEATPKRGRDSWADLMQRKKFDCSLDSVADTPSRLSGIGGNARSELRLKRLPRTSMDQSLVVSNFANDIEIKVSDYDASNDQTPKIRRNRLAEPERFGDLHLIQEEASETDGKLKGDSQLEKKMPLSESNHSNVAIGRKRRSTFHDSFSMHIKNINTSSPTAQPNNDEENRFDEGARRINAKVLRSMINRVANEKIGDFQIAMSSKMQNANDALTTHIDKCSDQASNDMKNMLERFYLLGLQGGENLMNRMVEPFELLEGALCTMLERDQYALDYFRMKFEIIELKKKLGIRDPSILHHLH